MFMGSQSSPLKLVTDFTSVHWLEGSGPGSCFFHSFKINDTIYQSYSQAESLNLYLNVVICSNLFCEILFWNTVTILAMRGRTIWKTLIVPFSQYTLFVRNGYFELTVRIVFYTFFVAFAKSAAVLHYSNFNAFSKFVIIVNGANYGETVI